MHDSASHAPPSTSLDAQGGAVSPQSSDEGLAIHSRTVTPTCMPVERQQWIDRAKGFAILLVVYGHVTRGMDKAGIMPLNGPLAVIDAAIYAFHMPLFFALSGCLFCTALRSKGPALMLANKWDSIIYPYVLWSLLHGGLELVLDRWTNHATSIGDVLSFVWRPRIHFWFLHALFLCFLVQCALSSRSLRHGYVGGLLFAIVGLAWAFLMPPIPGISALLPVFPFFLLGAIHGCELRTSVARYLALGLACAAAFVVIHAAPDAVAVALAPSLTLLGIAATCGLLTTPNMPGASCLDLLGRYSFEIYLLHVIAAAGVRIIFQKFLGISHPTLHVALGITAGIALPMLTARICTRLGWEWCWKAPRWLSGERLVRRLHDH